MLERSGRNRANHDGTPCGYGVAILDPAAEAFFQLPCKKCRGIWNDYQMKVYSMNESRVASNGLQIQHTGLGPRNMDREMV